MKKDRKYYGKILEEMHVVAVARQYEALLGVSHCVLGVDPYEPILRQGGPQAARIRELRDRAYKMAREEVEESKKSDQSHQVA